MVGEWDRVKAWQADGSFSAAAWLEHRTPLAAHQARTTVKCSRLVDQHEPLGAALRAGEISTPHVDAIGRVASRERRPLLASGARSSLTTSKHSWSTPEASERETSPW